MSISPDHFALCFTEALKCPDIQNLLKDITRPTHEELRDMFSAELHRQLQPLKDMIDQKDQEILELKEAVADLRSELDQLEQHGRRDSLRFSGIPENPAHDNTDNKILDICNAMELDPRYNRQTSQYPTDSEKVHQVKPDRSLLNFQHGIFASVFSRPEQNWKTTTMQILTNPTYM